MLNEPAKKPNLADKLFEEIVHPSSKEITSVGHDEALIVLRYMHDEYKAAETRKDPDSFQLPEDFAPQNKLPDLFKDAFKMLEYGWGSEQENTKHQRCSIVYNSLRKVANADNSPIAIKIECIETLVYKTLNPSLASRCAGKKTPFLWITQPVSDKDAFYEQQ